MKSVRTEDWNSYFVRTQTALLKLYKALYIIPQFAEGVVPAEDTQSKQLSWTT